MLQTLRGPLLTRFHHSFGLQLLSQSAPCRHWRMFSTNTGRVTAFPKSSLEVCTRSESPLPADSVEKHRIAGAESWAMNAAQAPFLSGFAHLLRYRKDLG
jgi:hypothetical protein